MSTKVIERPAAYSFSKNEIRYKFLTDNLAPANLFVQVQLWARPYKTASFLNWSIDQNLAPYIDNNIFIDVNGVRMVSEFANGTGTLNLTSGDVVLITQINFDAWPAGDPYVKMIIKKDATVLENEYITDGTVAVAHTWTFTVEANYTYTVYTYTREHSVVSYLTDLAMPTVNSFTLLKTFNLKPNTDGSTYLYIDAYIDSLLKWILPQINTTYTNASQQACDFYICFREISALTPDPAWLETEIAKTRIALKGGIEKQKSSRNNYFLYQTANKNIFSWMPAGRFVFADQPAWISVLIKVPATYTLRLAIKKSDGTTVSHDESLVLTSGIFYHINASYSVLDIATLAGGDQVHYYELSLLSADALTTIYALHRFYVEYRPCYTIFDLLYHNSLGGMDTARVMGELEMSIDKEVINLGGGMSTTGWSDPVKTAESGQYITKQDTYRGDLGFIRSKADQDALQDLLISTSVYQWTDSRMVQVISLQAAVKLRKLSDKIFSLPIEIQLPFANQVNTPKSIELGLGTDTETYD